MGCEGLEDGGLDRGRRFNALESRREEVELAESRTMEQIGLTAEVAKPCRGLGTDDGDPDELNRCRELLVACVETSLLEMLTDSGQFGGEVTEGVGRVNVFDDQIETVKGVEADFRQAENLDIGFEIPPGGFLELGCDRLCLFRQMTPFAWARMSPRSLRSVRVRYRWPFLPRSSLISARTQTAVGNPSSMTPFT